MNVTVYSRLDKYLAENGYAGNAERARGLIESGQVMVNGQLITSSAFPMHESFRIDIVKPDETPWITREGMKLDYALRAFGIDVRDRVAIDPASGAGGFASTLLRHGARRVYCIESMTGELQKNLRSDDKITVLKETDPRRVDKNMFPEPYNLITAAVPFMSLTEALPRILDLAPSKADLLAVIMPQFEVDSPDMILTGGIVVDPVLHRDACALIETWLRDQMKWEIKGFTQNPTPGESGNREFFVHARKP